MTDAAGPPPVSAYLRVLRRELAASAAQVEAAGRLHDTLAMAVALLDYLAVRVDQPDLGTAPTAAAASDWPARMAQVRCEYAALNAAAQAEQAEANASTPTVLHARITETTVQAYLQARCGPALRIAAMSSPLGGYSKDTFIVQLEGTDRPADAVVLRCDTPNGPLESAAAAELQILRVMHDAGVPVAEPLWAETDLSIFGRPFLVTRRVAGAPVMNFREEIKDSSGNAIAAQFAVLLADIHAVDPRAVPGLEDQAALPTSAHILGLLDQFEQQLQRRGGLDSAIVTTAFAWMREHVPATTAPCRVVHGDPTQRNLMVQHGRITALLDWETWHLGDAAEDLAYCRDEMELLMPWEEFLALYLARRGGSVDPAALRYWSMWKYLRGVITSVSLTDNVRDPLTCDLRTAFGGNHFTRFLLQRLAEALERL